MGYTGHLSINGIPGHHYHTIGNNIQPRSPPEENNNNNTNETTNQNAAPSTTSQFFSQEQNIVSSSQDNLNDVKNELSMDDYPIDYPGEDIEDFPYPIIPDTTVSNEIDDNTSRDSWMDLDALIKETSNQIKTTTIQDYVERETFNDNLNDGPPSLPIIISFPHHNNNNNTTTTNNNNKVQPNNSMYLISFPHHNNNNNTTTTNNNNKVQPNNSMYPCNNMSISLLQERLKNGPPKNDYTSTSPSSSTPTLYLAHSPQQVPHVVSTSDLVMRYQPVHSSTRPSPELQVSFPHTTTPTKKSRNKASRMKQVNSQQTPSSSTILYDSNNLGKEKPVHRCTICNRGFLNKSNIKVHLRTHTGEKR
ncbi:LOW QUALITY PROTEIN: ichor, partial [Diaphorina citri]|uniref:LOW QUALITY PROTEIN: ichor n=1 Tax=Diaphorina citri TaxID=121845 RepID=A0A1S3DG38_DIACI